MVSSKSTRVPINGQAADGNYVNPVVEPGPPAEPIVEIPNSGMVEPVKVASASASSINENAIARQLSMRGFGLSAL